MEIYSSKLLKKDLDDFDYIFVMDDNNIRNIKREFGDYKREKIMKLLDLSNNPREIADPWYTGNFDDTFRDVLEGCECLMKKLKKDIK